MWLCIARWICSDSVVEKESISAYFLHFCVLTKRKFNSPTLLCITVCWSLWSYRSNILFNNGVVWVYNLFETDKFLAWDWWITKNKGHLFFVIGKLGNLIWTLTFQTLNLFFSSSFVRLEYPLCSLSISFSLIIKNKEQN